MPIKTINKKSKHAPVFLKFQGEEGFICNYAKGNRKNYLAFVAPVVDVVPTPIPPPYISPDINPPVHPPTPSPIGVILPLPNWDNLDCNSILVAMGEVKNFLRTATLTPDMMAIYQTGLNYASDLYSRKGCNVTPPPPPPPPPNPNPIVVVPPVTGTVVGGGAIGGGSIGGGGGGGAAQKQATPTPTSKFNWWWLLLVAGAVYFVAKKKKQ